MTESPLKARLHPVGRHGLYNVLFDDKLLVERSREPEFDAARALLAQGITGTLILCDGKTGIPRTIIDIESSARLTVTEESRDELASGSTGGVRINRRPAPKTWSRQPDPISML